MVKIIGLAAGIAFTLIIASYVWSELQVNRNLKNADDQYIIQSKWKDPNQGIELTSLGPLAKQLKEKYPDLVANYYRWDGVTSNVSKADRSFRRAYRFVTAPCLRCMALLYYMAMLQRLLMALSQL